MVFGGNKKCKLFLFYDSVDRLHMFIVGIFMGWSVMEKEEIQLELERQRQRVDVEHVDMTIRELVRMANDGELIRSPEYQRKFRWHDANESKLVESIFLGLPVPAIYVAANANGSWELVDGLQRVSTLIHYVADPIEDVKSLESIDKDSPLRLHGLEKLSSFNDKLFLDLPTPMRLAFLKRMLRVTALSDKSDLEVRFDLFERLNTGGVALSPQEVRACVYKGRFRDVIKMLADDPKFVDLIKLQAKRNNDGTREEQVLKFFAYLERRDNFKGAVKSFLNDYAEALSKQEDFDARIALFGEVVSRLHALVNGPLLRPGLYITPLNQFEAIMVAAAEELQADVTPFAPQDNWLADRELVEASTGATNTKRMLDARIVRARALLRGAAVTPLLAEIDLLKLELE